MPRTNINPPLTDDRLQYVTEKTDRLADNMKKVIFAFIDQNYKHNLTYGEILEVIANAISKQMISLNALCSDAYQCDPDDTFDGLLRILNGLYDLNKRRQTLN